MRSLLCSFALLFVTGVLPAQEALRLHPDNDRYLQYNGRPIVLVTSAEHYGLLLNRAFDFDVYFQELARHGLNHTRVFSGAYRELPSSFGITQNPLAPTDANYICPWARTDQAHRDGSPIFDLQRWDEAYFERLDALLRSAKRNGIIVELCIFSPMYKPNLWDVNPMNIRNNVNEVGDVGSKMVYTTKHEGLLGVQKRLASKLTEFLQPYPNVYIEVCNEPYWGADEDWERAILDEMQATQDRLQGKLLFSVNVANKTKVIENPHPAVSIFNFHYCHPPIVVQQNSHVRGVIGENETGFRGQSDFLYRTEAWDFLLAGGGLYNNLDYSFSVKHPAGTLENYESPGGGSRDLRRQLGILKKQFDELPIPELRPQVDSVVDVGDGLVASSIGKPGEVYLVYVHVDLPGRLRDQPPEKFRQPVDDAKLTMTLSAGRYRVTQLDPKTGHSQSLDPLNVADSESITIGLPTFVTDTALRIEK